MRFIIHIYGVGRVADGGGPENGRCAPHVSSRRHHARHEYREFVERVRRLREQFEQAHCTNH